MKMMNATKATAPRTTIAQAANMNGFSVTNPMTSSKQNNPISSRNIA